MRKDLLNLQSFNVGKVETHAFVNILDDYSFLIFQYFDQKRMPYRQDEFWVMLDDHLSHSDDFRWRVVVKRIQKFELFDQVFVELISDWLEVDLLGVQALQVTQLRFCL